MIRPIPFVKREHELIYIDHLVNEWGTRRILCIDAPAGFGKTCLLHEAHQRYRSKKGETASLIVTNIIDFEDPKHHIPQHVGFTIAHMLNERIFEPYLRVLLDWRKMGVSGVSSERMAQAAFAINQTFVNCFNMVSSQQRVILFMDTIDALRDVEVLDYLAQVASQLENTTILIAGRNVRQIAKLCYQKRDGEVEVMELPPFSEHSSESSIRQKRDLLHLAPDPELTRKLVAFTRGHPILIDLAVSWSARTTLPDWLQHSSLDELQSLPDEQQHQNQQEFEALLAHHIANTSYLMGRLVLAMAHVYPVDVELIARLFALMDDEATALMKEVSSHAFVHQLPDGRITLHDEMRRLVAQYAWPVVDPSGERQQYESQVAADYLKEKEQEILSGIAQLDIAQERIQQEVHTSIALNHFVEREVLERTLWQNKGQQLSHTLFVDSDEGIRTFIAMFGEATNAYRFRFREALFDYIIPYRDHLSPEQQHALESRRIICLFDAGEYTEVQQLATTLLEQEHMNHEQQIDLLIYRGNAEIRLGHLDQCIGDFEHAMQMSREYGYQALLLRALNARGWAYRNHGYHDLALEDYLEAYQISLYQNDLHQIAWILNNIAFINTLKGNRQAAFESCRAALDICQTRGFIRCMGAVHSTMGGIYVRFDQPAEALKHYTRALDIFSAQNDTDWMSLVHCGRSHAFQSRGELDKATEALNWAWQHGPKQLRPRILYARAIICWMRSDLDGARQQLQECRRVSQQRGDFFHDYKSFADLTELSWEFGEFHRWQEFAQELNRLYTGIVVSEDILRVRGSCLRKIGDMAICHGAYEDALAAYKEGLMLIAEHEVHEKYMLRSQIRQTDRRVRDHVAPEHMQHLGVALAHFWQEHKTLMKQYPDALLIFYRWQREDNAA